MTINNYPSDWFDQPGQKTSRLLLEYPQARVYALIEGVLSESCYPFLKRSGGLMYFPLYMNTPSADEETLCISPVLVEYRHDAVDTWNALLKKTDGKAALSIIATTESLTELAQRLTPWCIVNAAGYTLALSFADTRILPKLFDVLTPQQLSQICGPSLHWQYVTRAAAWKALPLADSSAPPAAEVVLDERQCAQLMTAAEADNVLHQLRTTSASLVDCHTPARSHELVQHWLQCADHAHINAAPDRTGLCEWGLARPGLESNPRIIAWLAAKSEPQTLESFQRNWQPK